MAKAKKDDDFSYLVRVANTDIDGNKKVPVGLSSVKGIGTRVGGVICNLAKVDPTKKMGYLKEDEVQKLDTIAKEFQAQSVPTWFFNRRKDYDTGKDFHLLGADLMMSLREDINRLRKIRSYRGIRHEAGLPVRGQRTRTSFRRGTTVGVSRKKARQQQQK